MDNEAIIKQLEALAERNRPSLGWIRALILVIGLISVVFIGDHVADTYTAVGLSINIGIFMILGIIYTYEKEKK